MGHRATERAVGGAVTESNTAITHKNRARWLSASLVAPMAGSLRHT
jgi:hypothetical protein